MKKLLYILLLITGFSNAQIVNIPDANFKGKLLQANSTNQIAKNLSNNYFKIDSNNDGQIQVSEAEQVSYLYVPLSNISSLVGIENFINLRTLTCSGNQLISLNVLSLTNLIFLYCDNNLLNNLDLSGMTNLINLDCRNNQLTSLNVSGMTNLQTFFCDFNFITTLNLMDSKNLGNLNCNNNQLTSLFIKNGKIEGNIQFSNNPNLEYICSDENQINNLQSLLVSYGIASTCHINSYCSFTPGGTFYTLQGNQKIDINENGCDENDLNMANVKFNISDGSQTITMISNSSGSFLLPIGSGTFTITPVFENPSFFSSSPSNIVVDFPSQASPVIQNFCITILPHHDVRVSLIPITPARPGFDATYKLIYKNKGNQIENGVVTLGFNDSVLDFVSAIPSFSSQVTNSLVWNFTNLLPFESREITIVLNLNSPTEIPPVNIGNMLSLLGSITIIDTDEFIVDNSSPLRQIVVGSYDPNDKTCIEGQTVSSDIIGQYVHYVVRFENTGTYPAQNIVVKDVIDTTKFDISTLIPIHSSHNFETRISETNKVEFIFENINLPFDDAINDGYVAFKIKTKPTLVVGDAFSNLANIYFDYNFPIVTNNYTTTIQNPLGLQENNLMPDINIFPNPVKDVLFFKSKENVLKVEVYDVAGRILRSNSISENKMDLSDLKKGNYIVKFYTEKGVINSKIIKE